MHISPKKLLTFIFSLVTLQLHAFDLYWPTPNTAFLQGKPIEAYLQPTVSGNPDSGNFGCVRNNGYKFHEGIDLKPIKRNKHQEPLDAIYAALSGRVAYVNTVGGNSAFGKYIILVHEELDIPFYTLYAHLSNLDPQVKQGAWIAGGTQLGTMGRTATKPIPKHLAHMHFEIGVRLGNHFESWYEQKKFSTPNYHGQWNGMNLIGIDPLHFYNHYLQNHNFPAKEYLKNLPTAFTLEIASTKTPDFIKRYPGLLTLPPPFSGLKGWRIDFTWYGLPKSWTPLNQLQKTDKKISILHYDKSVQEKYKGRKMVVEDKKGQAQISEKLSDIMKLLFN